MILLGRNNFPHDKNKYWASLENISSTDYLPLWRHAMAILLPRCTGIILLLTNIPKKPDLVYVAHATDDIKSMNNSQRFLKTYCKMSWKISPDPCTKELILKEYTIPSVLKKWTELNFSNIEYNLKLLPAQWLFIPPHYRGFTITLI